MNALERGNDPELFWVSTIQPQGFLEEGVRSIRVNEGDLTVLCWLLPVKMEEGATRQEMRVSLRIWPKRQRTSSLEPPEGASPADTVTLDQH